jgi:hypothetical protein
MALIVRVTTRHNAVWRNCSSCQELAPLAPNERTCKACRPTGCAAEPKGQAL